MRSSRSQPCADAGPNSPRSPLAQRLLRLLEDHPDEWAINAYTAIHRPSRLELWTSNGWPYMEVYSEPKATFSLLDRWRLTRAVKALSRRIWLTKLDEAARATGPASPHGNSGRTQ